MYMSPELPARDQCRVNAWLPLSIGLVMLLALAGCVSTASKALPADVAANQAQVAPGVYLAGELSQNRIDALAASDVLVVDLRTQAEGTAEEARTLATAGVGYVNLPVSGASIDPAAVTSLASLLGNREGHDTRPVLLHCRSGNRAGMLYAAHLIDTGVSAEDALEAVDDVVTVDAISEAVKSYAQGR